VRDNLKQNLLTASIYALIGLIGLAAFTYPFFLPRLAVETNDFRAEMAPMLTLVLLVICLGVLLLEVQGQAVSSKMVAALGVLVAASAALRFLEVSIPGPGGFSPIFVPVIFAGYVFGSRFGLLMGTMTLFVSALITGGVGPWLPYQMFVAGWIGLTAGWLPHPNNPRLELTMLIGVGIAWGILYGLIMNLYFWPFIGIGAGQSWDQDAGLGQAAGGFAAFYVTTSLAWDLARAAGNALLILVLGLPTIRALSRFHDKFRFRIQGA
jgi:energy-coupling factor transport system substrate-specific component